MMRQNIVISLLAVTATLLALHLVIALREAPRFQPVFGQAAAVEGAGVLMATANTQNEVFAFLYDTKTKHLTCYNVRGGGAGIDLRGVRSLEFDFDPDLQEYPDANKPTSPKNMKKVIESAKKK